MKNLVIVLFISTILFSCTDNLSESKICNVKNPLIDLVWLKEIKTGLEISTSASKKKITQFTYNNESVFLVDICINCFAAECQLECRDVFRRLKPHGLHLLQYSVP